MPGEIFEKFCWNIKTHETVSGTTLSLLKVNSRERLVPFLSILGQWSPACLMPGTGFVEENLSMDKVGKVSG